VLFCNSGCIHLDYGNMVHKVYRWGFSCLNYSFDILTLWNRKLILYNWFCLYLVLSFIGFLSVLWYFRSLGDNANYMNSGYGDVRYTVYIWEFSCLDYFFNVLISRIGNLGLFHCLLLYACAHDTIFNACSW